MKNSCLIKKITAVGLAALMICGLSACGKTEETEESLAENIAPAVTYNTPADYVIKKETVYVNIDNTGKVSNVQVTDWLHTDKNEVYIDDVSDLKNIENIKTDNAPKISGNNLRWNMPDTDLYYSGKADKKLPVEIGLKYYLDGKELSPKEIAGKSGKVKIEINMKNVCSKKVQINGIEQTIYLPVMVVGGMILPEAKFSGVSVENGRAIGDGTKEIVAFYGMPGMSESLGFKDLGVTDLEGLVIGSSASVTADAKSFELGNMYFAVLPIASLNIELEGKDSVNDLKSVLGALSEVQAAISELDTDALMNLITNNSDSLNSLTSVVADAVDLYNSNKALIEVLSKYATPENGEQMCKLLKFLSSSDTIKALNILSDSSVVKFFAGLNELSDAMPIADSLISELRKPEVQKAMENLPETLAKLGEIQATISKNSDVIDTFLSLLSEESMDAIQSIMGLVGSADFADLAEKYSALAMNADDIVMRIESWLDFGKEYKIFTSAAENMQTSLLFIYMTPEIKTTPKNEISPSEPTTDSIIDVFMKKFK